MSANISIVPVTFEVIARLFDDGGISLDSDFYITMTKLV